jgi:colicin import membrane protein
MQAALPLDDLRPRHPGGMGAGALMALLAHAALVVALALMVNWRVSEPAGVEAELWAAVPQVAAPRPEPEPPQPTPQPVPQPRVEPPPTREADIAIEKAERAKKEKTLADEERAEKEKEREADRKKQIEEQKRKKADEERLARQREENLKRMQGMVGASGPPTSTGTAAQSAGPSASYTGRIIARIKPNIVVLDEIDGNPVAVVQVRAAPDGTIIGRSLLKTSGSKSWDEAVLRAVDRTEVLPRDVDGRVPSTIIIDFRPRD